MEDSDNFYVHIFSLSYAHYLISILNDKNKTIKHLFLLYVFIYMKINTCKKKLSTKKYNNQMTTKKKEIYLMIVLIKTFIDD